MYNNYLIFDFVALAYSCRALPGLPLLLALPKRSQKASAEPLGDLSNGLPAESNLRAIAPFDSTPPLPDRYPPVGPYAQKANARQELRCTSLVVALP